MFGQLFIIFVSNFLSYYYIEFRDSKLSNAESFLNLQNSFEDSDCMHYSPLYFNPFLPFWLAHFPDFHETLLKSGKWEVTMV